MIGNNIYYIIKWGNLANNRQRIPLVFPNSKFANSKQTLPCLCLKASYEQSMIPKKVLEIGCGFELTKLLENKIKNKKSLPLAR